MKDDDTKLAIRLKIAKWEALAEILSLPEVRLMMNEAFKEAKMKADAKKKHP